MANQGAKKRKEENIHHMRNLLHRIIACKVVQLLIRAGFFHSTFEWKHWVGVILTSLAYIISYQQLVLMAKPAYGDDGELLDGGFDMSTGGVCGWSTTFLLIVAICLTCLAPFLVSLFTKILAFASYQLFGLVKGFLPGGLEGPEEDEKSRKKREKMEKRASGGKFVKTRNR